MRGKVLGCAIAMAATAVLAVSPAAAGTCGSATPANAETATALPPVTRNFRRVGWRVGVESGSVFGMEAFMIILSTAGIAHTNFLSCSSDRPACSTVPHSTESTRSRFALRQSLITRAQSMTPSPHAQPTGVPVTLPRWEEDC